MSRLPITLSVSLNLFLITTMVAARVDLTRTREGADVGSALDRPVVLDRPTEEAPTTIEEYYASLRSLGIGDEQARPMVSAWLSRRRAERARARVQPYWRARDEAAIEADLERLDVESRERRALRAVFGEGVVHDPYFSPFFELLGPRFSFLTPTEQAALERQALERELDATRSADGSGNVVCVAGRYFPAGGVASAAEPGVLGTAAAFEYGLRVSPLAEQLRVAGLALDEEAFRGAFELLLELESHPDAAMSARVRRELGGMLGERAFDRLWSLRDPAYSSLRDMLDARGFAPGVIEGAYAVVNRAQEQLLELNVARIDRDRFLELARAVAEDERRALEELVGEQAAASVLAERRRTALEGGRRPATGC